MGGGIAGSKVFGGDPMRVRFGAILCLILGAVLIQSGLSSGGTSTVGTAGPCPVDVGAVNGSCPQGTLTLHETTDANGNTEASPPSTWTVHLSSTNCFVSSSYASQPISNGGTLTYSELYIYNLSFTARCEYTITEDAVAPYTASFNPLPPYTFYDDIPLPVQAGFRPNVKGGAQTVTLTNTAAAASSTPAPTPTKTKTRTASATATAPSEPAASTSFPVASSSAAPVLASTGPRHQVRGSLIAGIALVLLGGVLLLAGRRPRRARHT